MTTEPTPLQERIRRARSVPADWAKLREGESTREQIERHQERMDEQTAALIAAEVRKGQAEALREAAEKMSRQREANYLEELADEIEQED